MRKIDKIKWGLVILVLLGFQPATYSQLSLTGQLRTRTELRDGLGNLSPLDSKAAAFTSQRTRLTFNYKWDRVVFQTALQDIRVWGQDAATISNADGNKLSTHEAWAEVILANSADTTIKFRPIQNLSLKIGRQELVYDDVRLLGNLDWLQQARRFDAALLKAQHMGWVLDLGVGFNQNTDAFGVTGTNYVGGNAPTSALSNKNVTLSIPAGFLPTNGKGGAPVLATVLSTNGQNQNFKSFQMAYLSRKFKQTKLSLLFFKDDFSKYRPDSIGNVNQGYVYGRRYDVVGVNSRITYGGMLNGQFGNATSKAGKISWQAWGYLQSGKDRDGLEISNAHHYGAFLMLQKSKFSIGPSYEVLSGNNGFTQKTGTTSRFDPLYGTPHKHWGYMDYFYVGTGSPVGGLVDAQIKTKYAGSKLTATFDAHYFGLASSTPNRLSDAPAGSEIDSKLGFEYDFVATYTLNKFTTIELGYSIMQATNSLEYVKQNTIDKMKRTGNWGYLMINIKPDFFYTKTVRS
ncbi:MAG: alginate export family protein [Leadbetterella sp.]